MRLLRVRVQSMRRAFVRALPLPSVHSEVRVRLSALRQLLRVRIRRHRVRRQRVRVSGLFPLLSLRLPPSDVRVRLLAHEQPAHRVRVFPDWGKQFSVSPRKSFAREGRASL